MERVLHHLIVRRVPALVELLDEGLEARRRLVSLRVQPRVQLHLVVSLESRDLLWRWHRTRHLQQHHHGCECRQ